MQIIDMRFFIKVEQEHEEQMRQLKQRKKKQATPPPPPKTITVMAGKIERNHNSILINLLYYVIGNVFLCYISFNVVIFKEAEVKQHGPLLQDQAVGSDQSKSS